MGSACTQNEQHLVCQYNSSVDTQRKKTGKRKPKRIWRDNSKEVDSSQWMTVAQNQSAWHELWRPSASSDMIGWDDDDDEISTDVL